MKRINARCRDCRRVTEHTKDETLPIVVHVLLFLFLCGLWIFPWAIIAYFEAQDPWFCSWCGRSRR